MSLRDFAYVRFGPIATEERTFQNRSYVPILLQKSKIAEGQIFRETIKREAIADSYNLNRVTEVAYEFSAAR